MRSRGRIVKSDFEERFGDLEHADGIVVISL
jgi:hypothetical protein